MNLSSILVVVPPGKLGEILPILDSLPGVEVHHSDPATGRLIVIQEAATIGEEMEGLKRIQALPWVVLAEMIQHVFEEDSEILENKREGLKGASRWIRHDVSS
jgi:nitrate reductase NapD